MEIGWEHLAAVRSRAGKFLQFVGDENSLSRVLREPTRNDALLDLLVVNGEGLAGDGMVLAQLLLGRDRG